MTDKSHELLEAALDHLHGMNSYEDCLLKNRIRAYLAEPEVKREPLHLNDVVKAINDSEACGIMDNFIAGVLFAEKHHGIGDNNENPNT